MRPAPVLALIGLATVSVCLPTPSGALEALHSKVRVGPLTCFATHHHTGASEPRPTRAQAYAEAVRSWRGLTVLEYGEAWGSFERSAGKQIRCQRRADIDGKPWTCFLRSRPCRVTAATAR